MMEDNLDGPFQLKAGVPSDTISFHELRNLILQSDWTDSTDYEFVKSSMDVENFIDYWAATIYTGKKNADHNQSYWRLRNGHNFPGIREGWDGRWRWMALDFDNSFMDISWNNMEFMPQHVHDGMLLGLLLQPDFKKQFINRFADLLNSSFSVQNTTKRVNEMIAELTPEIAGQIGRWRSPSDMPSWNVGMQRLYSYAEEKTDTQRMQLKNFFSLPGEYLIHLDVSDAERGYIHINTIDINKDLPGVSETVYPWTGVYFDSVPVTITAIPEYGFLFDHWKETGSTSSTIIVDPASEATYTAIFKRDYTVSTGPVTMYPNPSVDGHVYFDKFHRVSVYDVSGKLVLPEQTVYELNIGHLDAGVYFVRFESGQEQKLVLLK
jgi:hypothetical protein